MSKYTHTQQTIRYVREQTDIAVLFYSAGGKDGIALLDMLAKQFSKVICYYMYLVPGLKHIAPYIQWAEKYGNVEVRQIEHYQKSVMRKNGFYCEPQPDTEVNTVGLVEEAVRRETGQKYAFSGMKGVDGYMKRMRIKTFVKRNQFHFPISEKGMVYPLAEWTNGEVLQYIRKYNLISPFSYVDGRVSQGFGIDIDTLLYLYRFFPSDYEQTIREFPYATKILFDYAKEKQSTATYSKGHPKKPN